MNDTQKVKISRFLDDVVMSDAVHQVLLNIYLKKKANQDVYQLAASRMAIDMLNDSWAELEKYRIEAEANRPTPVQIGM